MLIHNLLSLSILSFGKQSADFWKALCCIRILIVGLATAPHGNLIQNNMFPVNATIRHHSKPSVSQRQSLLPDSGRCTIIQTVIDTVCNIIDIFLRPRICGDTDGNGGYGQYGSNCKPNRMNKSRCYHTIVISQVVSIKSLSKTSLQPVGRSKRTLRGIRDIDKVLESGYFLQIRYRHHVLRLWPMPFLHRMSHYECHALKIR